MNIQLFQHHLLKSIIFLHLFFLAPVLKISWPYKCRSILGKVMERMWQTVDAEVRPRQLEAHHPLTCPWNVHSAHCSPQWEPFSGKYPWESSVLLFSCYVLCDPCFVTPWTVAHQALLSFGILQTRVLEWAAISFSEYDVETTNWYAGVNPIKAFV